MNTKCANGHCPARANCWRFVAPARPEQGFKMYRHDKKTGQCGDYIYVTDREKRAGGPKLLAAEVING